ncbi:kinase-like domain-containing protein [Mycena olivaceomarginata]|nr:kinase-like domain-containing protein [Mycena olivaceomarginata]
MVDNRQVGAEATTGPASADLPRPTPLNANTGSSRFLQHRPALPPTPTRPPPPPPCPRDTFVCTRVAPLSHLPTPCLPPVPRYAVTCPTIRRCNPFYTSPPPILRHFASTLTDAATPVPPCAVLGRLILREFAFGGSWGRGGVDRGVRAESCLAGVVARISLPFEKSLCAGSELPLSLEAEAVPRRVGERRTDVVVLAGGRVTVMARCEEGESEAHSNFLYIALELCPATLADLIETPDRDAWGDIAVAFDLKHASRQIAGGLRHLHGLKLVHRDIKPQNILKLDADQTSFLPMSHGGIAAGTLGWRAPEILRGDGSAASGASSGTAGKPARLTKSVDIFALGCLFFYTLTNGGHPFGDRFEREANIMRGAKNLQGLERFGEEGEEAVDLISSMLHAEAQWKYTVFLPQ